MGTFMRTHGWKYGKHSIIKILCSSGDYQTVEDCSEKLNYTSVKILSKTRVFVTMVNRLLNINREYSLVFCIHPLSWVTLHVQLLWILSVIPFSSGGLLGRTINMWINKLLSCLHLCIQKSVPSLLSQRTICSIVSNFNKIDILLVLLKLGSIFIP